MKITIEPETEEDRKVRPDTLILHGVECFAIIGSARSKKAALAINEIHSGTSFGIPQLIGQLAVTQKMLQIRMMQPSPSNIQVPAVMPRFNGLPRG